MTVQRVSKLLQTNVVLKVQRCADMLFFHNKFLSMDRAQRRQERDLQWYTNGFYTTKIFVPM